MRIARLVGIAAALALIPTLPAAAGPAASRLAAPTALDGLAVGCAAWGYTITVPSDWTVAYLCIQHDTANSSDQRITLAMAVERHGFWNDARSRASIGADEQQGARLLGPIQWDSPTIAGHRYMRGLAHTTGSTGAATTLEMETFDRGSMFKFTGTVHHTTTSADRAGLALLRQIMGSATITGPVTGYAPATAPARPAPAPPQGNGGGASTITIKGVTYAISPDAPGVAVTATTPTIEQAGDYPPPDGSEYVVTRVTVVNAGDAKYDANPFDFTLVTPDLVSHTMAFDMNIGDTELQATTLAPGQAVSGDISFAIPDTVRQAGLFWEPAFASPKVIVPTHPASGS